MRDGESCVRVGAGGSWSGVLSSRASLLMQAEGLGVGKAG